MLIFGREKSEEGDVNTAIIEIPSQPYTTKDNVEVQITSLMYLHIAKPYKPTFRYVRTWLISMTQMTLRFVVGAQDFHDIIDRREELEQKVKEAVENVAVTSGVLVEHILIRDINLSRNSQDTVSMTTQSKRLQGSIVPNSNTFILEMRC